MRQLMAIRRILDIEIPADLAILRANCTPVAMDKGLRFAIREGGRTVGAGTVSEILAK